MPTPNTCTQSSSSTPCSLLVPSPLTGVPFPNLHVYILGPDNQEMPPGGTGEVFVGGPVLARGYLNMPEKTAERFVENPFGEGSQPYAQS